MNEFIPFVVALIGQKNVGKSTLFNRLTRTNAALISNHNLGLTRDRQYGCVQYKKYEFMIVDTGGLNRLCNTMMQNHINNQTMLAAQESDILLFMVNGQTQVSSIDYDIVNYLRKLEKNIFIIINKIDNSKNNYHYLAYDYYNLGIASIILISAMHGYGIKGLLEKIFFHISRHCANYNNNRIVSKNQNTLFYEKLRNTALLYKTNRFIKLAVVGRPNSGKSTFINYILKTNRMITDETSGTTRDSIYIPTIYNNQKYILVDTAGVRRKKQIHDIIERVSVMQTLQVLKDVHVVLFMIDINAGIVDQDLSLLRLVLNNSQSLIIVINKWDGSNLLIMRKKFNQLLVEKLSFLNNFETHFISSLYGNGIKILFKSINQVYQSSMKTFSTAQLTRIMYKAVIKHPPSFVLGTRIAPKPKYVHIGGYNPIIIVIHGSQVSKLSREYQRYLKQFFYQSLNINGVLIHIRFKDTMNPFKNIL